MAESFWGRFTELFMPSYLSDCLYHLKQTKIRIVMSVKPEDVCKTLTFSFLGNRGDVPHYMPSFDMIDPLYHLK